MWENAHYYAIETDKDVTKKCLEKGFSVLEKTIEESTEWNQIADLVTCLEVVEHVFDPLSFIKAIGALVKSRGYCLIASLCGDRFDLKVLGEKSKSLFPSHHLNFLSVRGYELLFKRAGLIT